MRRSAQDYPRRSYSAATLIANARALVYPLPLSPLGPLLFLALPLLLLLLIALVRGHYVADDYCYAGRARSLGLWAAQRFWYLNWSGRFTYTSIASLLAFVGEWQTRVLPPLLVVSWIASLTYALTPLLSDRRSAGAGAVSLGALSLLSTSAALGDVAVWYTGTLTYVFPLSLLAIYTGWTLRGPTTGRLVLSAGMLLVSASFNETQAAIQTTALALAFGASYRVSSLRSRRGWLLVGLAASLAALVIVAASPGNAVRQTQPLYPSVPTGLGIPITILGFSALGLLVWGLMTPLYLAGALLAGWLLRPSLRPLSRRAARALLLGLLVLWTAGLAPSALMFGYLPYDHSMLFPMTLYTLGLALIGARLPRRWDVQRSRLAAPLIAVVVLVALVRTARVWHYFDAPTHPVQWVSDCTALYQSTLGD
jgi:hypothetical protein